MRISVKKQTRTKDEAREQARIAALEARVAELERKLGKKEKTEGD